MERNKNNYHQGGNRLDKTEKLVKDAELYFKEDKRKKEEVEVRNTADTMCYTAEKALRDAGIKVPAEVKSDVEAKVKTLGSSPVSSIEELKEKTKVLSDAMLQKIREHMYNKESSQGNPQDMPPSEDNS